MDLLDLIEAKRFLGAEFMMWLWFKGECFEGLHRLGEQGDVEVWFDDALSLEGYLAETERNDFKGGAPSYSPEAKTALQQGKRVTKAKLHIVRGGREWTATLKGESLDLGGIQIPALLTRESDEQFYERMMLVEELEQIIEALYAEFLVLRVGAVWQDALLPAMQAWVASLEPGTPQAYPSEAADAALLRASSQAQAQIAEVDPGVVVALEEAEAAIEAELVSLEEAEMAEDASAEAPF